jgi:hypothetical protein
MKARAACALVVCLAVGVVAASSKKLVDRSILITVLDKDNVPLRDLTAGDFAIMEDAQVRDVTAATLATDPMAVAIMIDTSTPPSGEDLPVRDIRAGLAVLVNAIYAANPQSKISLMDFSGAAVTTVGLTSAAETVLKATNRIVTSRQWSGVMLEGLVDVTKDLSKSGVPRRAIVVLSFDALEMSENSTRDVAAAVQKMGAAFWAVSVGSKTAPIRDAIFEHLPPLTGGRRITTQDPASLEKIFGQIGAALTSQYLVTYQRPEGPAAMHIRAGARKGASVLRSAWMK